MLLRIPAFVASFSDFVPIRQKLKLTSCPFCHLIGCLICHGFLYGNEEHGQGEIKRGWRIFCSNRDRRDGCGKTVSVHLAELIPCYSVTTTTLWTFMNSIQEGVAAAVALARAKSALSLNTVYRLENSVRNQQPSIRSVLRRIAVPILIAATPPFQIIAHLEAAFRTDSLSVSNPIAAFQQHFQKCFLGNNTKRQYPP